MSSAADKGDIQEGDLCGTLKNPALLAAFRDYLRALDGKAKAAAEIKGRFERSLEFLISMEELYSLAEGDHASAVAIMMRIRADHFDCPPAQRLATASQVRRSVNDDYALD